MEKNKTGNYSTNRETLEKYEGEHPIFDKLIQWRKLSKLKTGFVTPLLEYSERDGKVRSTFSQTGTATGRLSSKEPNLQNIPRNIKENEKNKVQLLRNAFIALEDEVIICVDFSQLELRIMAHFSEDPTLLEAYNAIGVDIHQITANECGCSRQQAKPINFGLIYGMGPILLAKTIGVSLDVAEEYHRKYFAKYLGVKGFHRKIWNTLDAQGYVTTLAKRRRRFPEWSMLGDSKSEYYHKLQLHRQAVNVVIQGSAADLVKISQRNIDRRIGKEGLPRTFQCSQVHDEIIARTTKDLGEYVLQLVVHEMENCVKLRVPLIADGKIAQSWGKCK